jgi:hypothetical protein
VPQVKTATNDRTKYLLPFKYEQEKCFLISVSGVNKQILSYKLKKNSTSNFEHDLMSIVIFKLLLICLIIMHLYIMHCVFIIPFNKTTHLYG